MSQPRQAKYCPQCSCIALADAPACGHCGHQFQTGRPEPAEADGGLHKTRMFFFPASARAGGDGGGTLARPPSGAGSRLRLAVRSVPWLLVLTILVNLALIALAFRWWRSGLAFP